MSILDPSVSGTNVSTFYNLASYYPIGSVTGIVKITLPVAWTDSLFNITVNIEDDSLSSPVKLLLGGNNSSSSGWLYTSASSSDLFPGNTIRFGYDGVNVCILLGTLSTMWSNPNINIDRVDLYHSTVISSSGWLVSLISSETGLSNLVTTALNAGYNQPVSSETQMFSSVINKNFNADKIDGYDAGNAENQVPVSNGILNSNLNADLLDGHHASDFAPAAGGGYASLNSPAFTGVPTSPTAAVDTNTDQIATTKFYINQASSSMPLADATTGVIGVSNHFARADHVHPTSTTPLNYETLASNIKMDGTASVGVLSTVARADHIHPSDTTRLALSGGTMTGPLILSSDPTVAFGAATKQYVDNLSNTNSITGPSSSTTNHIVVFEDTTGKIINDSGYSVNDTKIDTVSLWSASKILNVFSGINLDDGNASTNASYSVNTVIAANAAQLNGQPASYYLASSSYTASDVLTKLKTVDGAGSGLDADTLDGFSSSYFASTGYVDKFAAGTGSANANKMDHSIYSDTSGNVVQQAEIIDGNFQVSSIGASYDTKYAYANSVGYPIWDTWKVYTANTNCGFMRRHGPSCPGSYDYAAFVWTQAMTMGGADYQLLTFIENGVKLLCGYPALTISFMAKASASGSKLRFMFYQSYGTGGSVSNADYTTKDVTLSTTWQRYSLTFNPVDISTKTFGTNKDDTLNLEFINDGTFNTSSSGEIDIAQMQIDIGSVVLPYRNKTFAQELQQTMRYYEQCTPYGIPANANNSTGSIYKRAYNGTDFYNSEIMFEVIKRLPPTVLYYSTLGAVGSASRISDWSDWSITSGSSQMTNSKAHVYSSAGTLSANGIYAFKWSADARY